MPNMAIGANPGHHGIFDFIQRHPETMMPYLSSSETLEPSMILRMGSRQLPLSGPRINNLRRGKTFWEILCKADIPAVINQIPANYPPDCPCQKDSLKMLSGMGTPDLLGSQGTLSYYTDLEEQKLKRVIGGAEIHFVTVKDDTVEASLYGPANPYKNPERCEDKNGCRLQVPFTVHIDRENAVVRIEVAGQKLLVKQGEFSDWARVPFDALGPLQRTWGITRFYLKDCRQHFKLYAAPLNIDPSKPAVKISQPEDYSAELAGAVGLFYTQNMPPDTKALEHKIFTDEEFLKQTALVFEEEKRRLDFELGRFESGLLFHYFCVLDQVSHVFWRATDPQSPLYTPELNKHHGKVIENYYIEYDRILGEVLGRIDPSACLLIMSDHGFAPFRREVNLNTLLANRGLITLKDPRMRRKVDYFGNVNWHKTRAYNLGINAVYVNLKGREKYGAVAPEDYGAVREEIRRALLELTDPKTGTHPISHVYRREDIYSGPYLDSAPDLLVGFEEGYRASWDTILGVITKEEVKDNRSPWSGDHSIEAGRVPGILVSNRPLPREDCSLTDIAPTVLEYFGLKPDEAMKGRSVL